MSASKSKADQPQVPGSPRANTGRRKPPKTIRQPRNLIDTIGPDPETPVDQVRLTIGTIVGVFGINGELKVRLATDDPEQLNEVKAVYVEGETTPRTLKSIRLHQGMGLIRLFGIDTPEEGSLFKGKNLKVAASDLRQLLPGQYYLYQLIGLHARTESGEDVGTVVDLIETGAKVVFVIRPTEGADILLPDLPEVILSINPAQREMVVHPLEYAD